MKELNKMKKIQYLSLLVGILYSGFIFSQTVSYTAPIAVNNNGIADNTNNKNAMEINQTNLANQHNSLTLTPKQQEKLKELFQDDKVDNTTQAAIKEVIPNTPQQIEALKRTYTQTTQAAELNPISAMELKSTYRTINLLRNPTPPLLHLVLNYSTNISFVGENGKPWPIQNIVPGDKDAIEVDQSGKNDLFNSTITVKLPYVSTNVTYYLKGRVKPIVLFIHTAPDTSQGLDASVNVTLSGIAPGTSPLPVKNVGVVSDDLLNAVNNAPGSQWQPVSLDSDNLSIGLQMWTSSDHQRAIVRVSSGSLISPDWSSEASNPDNTVTAYSFNYFPLMLLANSRDGQSFQVRVKQAVQTLAGEESSKSDDSAASIKNISDIENEAQMRISHAQ